jgi:hypothetical protein
MMGTELVPETWFILNHLTRLEALERSIAANKHIYEGIKDMTTWRMLATAKYIIFNNPVYGGLNN